MVRATQREAEAIAPLAADKGARTASMFEQVYAEMPWHLRAQADALEAM